MAKITVEYLRKLESEWGVEKVVELLNEKASEPEWISVKERLPEKGNRVLCVQDPNKTATKEALFGIYDGINFIPPTPTYFANFEVGQSKWVDITHWMPLPNKPN